MQAIVTKWHSPTNKRGARMTASCQAKRISLAYDHRLTVTGNHDEVAGVLASQLDWQGRWYGGDGLTGNDRIYVLVEGLPAFSVPRTLTIR